MNNRPGIHKNVNLHEARFGTSERIIIEKLSKHWFITFARTANFKGAAYSFAFAKPSTKLSQNFQLDREVLILFGKFMNFDSRILDFVDKTLFEYQNRLDKLCFLLISKDTQIREKINQLNIQEPESRIIIPYNYNDFFDQNCDEIILNRLAEQFYGRDLYSYESPLQNDTYFFGRSSIVQYLYDNYKNGGNSGLFGLRKIGKTSVLYALLRQLNFRGEFGIFIDCQEPSLHKSRWYEVLQYIIKLITDKLRTSQNLQIEISDNYNEKNASILFRTDMERIYSKLRNKRILLILDEIENITFDVSPSTNWKEGEDCHLFWQSIRSIYQNNPQLFSFVIAGVNPKLIETAQIRNYDNPIYRMIQPRYLSFFNIKNVREMVSTIGNYMGLKFEDEVYTYLTEDYGGHPFLIRQVCSLIHNDLGKDRPVTATKYYYKENKSRFDNSLNDYSEVMIQILRNWYPEEYTLLEHLAVGNNELFLKEATRSKQNIQHLIGYNLVEDSGNKYYIKIKAIEDYLKEYSKTINTELSIEDKWRTVTELRGKLEKKLSLLFKIHLKLIHGAQKGKEIFLSSIEEKRRNRLNANDLETILDKDEIYFSDYQKFIIHNWHDFERVFHDKNQFELYTNMINNYRIDAHAKNIENEEFLMLITALRSLNEKLDNFFK